MSQYPSWPCSYKSEESAQDSSVVKKKKNKKTSVKTKKVISTSDKSIKSVLNTEKVNIVLDDLLEKIKAVNANPQMVFSSYQGELFSLDSPSQDFTVTKTTKEVLANYSIYNPLPEENTAQLIAKICETYGIDSSNVESINVSREYGSNVHTITIDRYIF